METPAPFLIPPTSRPVILPAWLMRLPGLRYWAAAGMVLISLGVRLLLSPYLPASYGYTCFYPAVILSAYWLGARPALLVAGLSTAIVYNFMGPAPFSLPTDGQTIVRLGFFVVSSLLLVHVLSTIRARIDTLASIHGKVEALAADQAELFRDHAQRTTDHLQLVSAILQLQARDESDPVISRVLSNAASRTLLISRVHREFADSSGRGRISFEGFARKLVEAAAARGGVPSGRVSIVGGNRDVPLEQATALGLVLLEFLNILKARPGRPALRISLDGDDQGRSLHLVLIGNEGPIPGEMPLIEAITGQVGGRLEITHDAEGGGLRVTFPAELQPVQDWDPLAVSLH